MIVGKVYTVSDITKIIKGMFEEEKEFSNIQVQGEISNFRRYPSGHCYFSLKDKGGLLKAVMFAGSARRLKFEPHDGDSVYAIGRIGVYERDGVYQLYVDMLLPQGAGDLMLAFEKLKAKLSSEGLFAEEKKKKLPTNPERIGIITSSAGAAVKDIISVSRRRNKGIKLLLYPVRVQGVEAIDEIVHAIEFMNKENLADVLIVGRGGGSIEDLWAFNEEKVVRAIAASGIPTISAVGHEIDFTLADFAADKRAATPSQAAEIAVPESMDLSLKVQKFNLRMLRQIEQKISAHTKTLNSSLRSWVFTQPLRFLDEKKIRLDQSYEGLTSYMKDQFTERGHNLGVLIAKLDALSPLSILSRGYTVTETIQGKVIHSIGDINLNEEIVTRVMDGQIHAKVTELRKADN